ncbi:unnamed protein product [Candidula unifasciata]|uniref:FAS1 domain-containing protein n=1 Tax=Candidula unifasciata TaxID=100452 RepID=A0A8S3YVL1_9EUPU|nr:unnamed protein product [Candidula unifasciata]
MATPYMCLLLLVTTLISYSNGQSISVGNNAFESLDGLGCSQFKAIILEAQLQGTFTSAQALTVFVFNDTAYSLLPPYRQTGLYERSGTAEARQAASEYVNSFTLMEAVQTSAFSDAAPYQTYSSLNRKLFLNRRDLRIGNVASGLPGPTKYFCNGAMLIRPNIQAGQHVIHIIDQVLDMPIPYTALAFASGYNSKKIAYQFYVKIMQFLQQAPQEDGEYNYNKQVQRVLTGSQATFFLPSDEALNRIPAQKLSELQGNQRLMLDIITLHIVPSQVLYTSLVNHNERFNTQFNSGAVVFRKNYNREAVYVTGALSSGRTVTARITPANITVINGVVHQIDQLLGFVYNSAVEEISIDPVTQNFEQFITVGRKDLQNDLTSANGVTVFAPINQAMYAIANVYQNYMNNQSLINMVIEMSMLMQGQHINLMDYNAGYESYVTVVSRYNGRLIKVYSEGNDTWVEGGYVQARVVKPDIGVTNGVVHQIDAVFGIPTRDIPYTIFCKDWLASTFVQMQYVGLTKYMRDPLLVKNQECTFNGISATGSGVPNNGVYNPSTDTANPPDLYTGICGDGIQRCEFTYFVPNGTAIDNFARTTYGRQMMNDPRRWRWIFRRLITFRERIYLDQIAMGAPRSFLADNGEEIVVQIDSRNAYIMFEGVRAKIIRSDIGATNGVIHIISSLLFVPEDLDRDISGTYHTITSLHFVLLIVAVGTLVHCCLV